MNQRSGVLAMLAAMLAALALSACTRDLPPLAAANGPLVPPSRTLTLPGGTQLPAREWDPQAGTPVRGVILALHGFADSRDAWEYPGPVFAAAGWIVIAPDQEGFGATATRGTWPGAQRLVDDAAAMVRLLRAQYPARRLVVMGESMGGAVALCLAARGGPDAPDATVALAPAVWGRQQMGPILSSGLWLANGIAPHWTFTGREVPREIAPSDNREALLRLAHDPLTLRSAPVATLAGITDLMDAAQAASADLKGPVLVLAGRRDMVIPPRAQAIAWAKMPAATRRAFYPDGWHLLLRDRDRRLVSDDILAWLDNPDTWLPSGADVATQAWAQARGWDAEPFPLLPASITANLAHGSVWPY
jgi:acylglycerol lipase